MTAVIYARYSSDNQREESIEGQIRECTAYAEKNGITIVKHYIDRAISAKTDNRPEFQQMIKDSDKKLFDKAEDDYLLTTKLHCGCCGALMFGESGTSRTGEVHRYYKCATAKKKKGCKKKTVRKQWLEDLVVNQTMQLVRNDAAMESIIAKVMELQNKENTNIPLYEKQLRDAESGIQNMLNAIQAGILTSSTKERLEQLEETKRELEARIAEEKLAKPKVTEEFIRFWLLRFRKLDMSLKDQRQALVDTFINSIYLYDDKVLITFNYKEGTQTITFEEAAQAASKGNGSDLDCFPAPENAVKSKDFMAFLFCKPWLHGFCTVFARWVLSIFIRSNESLSIIHKVLRRSEHFLTERVQPIDAFGFPSAARGEKEPFDGCISLIHSQGTGYIKRSDVKKNAELIDKYKATISILVPCNGEVGIDPSKGYKAITTPRIEIPGEVNTFSYLVLGAFDTEEEIKNYKQYLMCKFTRFMLRLTYSSMHIARANFVFVPDQDFMETWTDEKLYKKYELTEEEIAFIESTIRVME